MSASEKLQALDEAMTEGYNRTLAKAKPPYSSTKEISTLRAALPQIVAVVQAAESFAESNGAAWPEVPTALAALDEALS